jgi:general stress protein 26
MTVPAAHRERIKRELAKAGMTAYGQLKMSSRHLPKIIAQDEHIEGVAYGWRGGGLAMLVATSQRIIYIERRPLFTSVDDLSYDIVAGVRIMDAGLFPSVDLHTRMGDYVLTYVNPTCAHRFARYIESRIERLPGQTSFELLPQVQKEEKEEAGEVPAITAASVDQGVRDFLKQHDVGVLSTANRTGQAYGSAVYYILGDDDRIYMITKSETTKAHNMLANNHVAFTVFDPKQAKTAQIMAYAEIEADFDTKHQIFERLVGFRDYNGDVMMPPVAQLSKGGFIAFRLTPFDIRFTDYRQLNRERLEKPPR